MPPPGLYGGVQFLAHAGFQHDQAAEVHGRLADLRVEGEAADDQRVGPFLRYAFDMWMTRNHPAIPFERYADDAICHCASEAEALALRVSLEEGFAECRLTPHPEKTKIVFCKDDDWRETYPDQKFDFLGYPFQPRLSRRRRGTFGVSFSPAASDKALKAIRPTVRSWTLHERSDKNAGRSGTDVQREYPRLDQPLRVLLQNRLVTQPCGTSTGYWRSGLVGGSNPYGVTGDARISLPNWGGS